MNRRADPLYVTDGEIANKLGLSHDEWVAATKALRGLPPTDPGFKFRRYWPAVKAYLDRRSGLHLLNAPADDGEETFDEDRNHRRPARAR